MHTTETYLTVAFQALDSIRPLLKENFGKPDKVKCKADGSLVTNVDPEAERMVREILQKHFPEHGILGEELESVNPDVSLQWIIDPIDGTKDFIHGIPVYGSILALYENGEPLLGVIDVPETDNRYHAIKGSGAFWNGSPIEIENCELKDVQEGILAVSSRSGFLKCGEEDAYDRLCQTHPGVLMLPNCYGHALAARGAATAMVNFNISLWDIAATKIIVEEANGKFAIRKRGDRYDMICGKPSVVDWLLDHFEMVPTGL